MKHKIIEINKEIMQLESRIKELKKLKRNKIDSLKKYNFKVDKIIILNKFRKFGISEKQLFTKSRKQELVYLRSMFFYLICKKHTQVMVSKETGFSRDAVKNSLDIIDNLKLTKDVKYYNTFKMICLE